jgi:hypothetical protein
MIDAGSEAWTGLSQSASDEAFSTTGGGHLSTAGRLGPPDAESAITGAVGEFCRVAVRRPDPAQTGLRASGPHGATVLRLVRTYAT